MPTRRRLLAGALATGAGLLATACGRSGRRRSDATTAGESAAAPASTAALPTAAALPSSTAALPSTTAALPSVAVVGAGLAGLVCAENLARAGFDVHVYEARDRVGGRVWTQRGLPGGQVVRGGEFIDSRHDALLDLVAELGLELDDLRAGYPEGAEGVLLLGGRETAYEAVMDGWGGAFLAVQGDLAAINAGEAAAIDALSVADWLAERLPDGPDGPLGRYLAAYATAEFGLDPAEQSALGLVYDLAASTRDELLLDSDGADERWHVRGGNDLVATALAERLPAGALELGVPLEAVRRRSDGGATLVLGGGGPREVAADLAVLALPFAALREVDLDGARLDTDRRRAIDELGVATNAKVLLGTRDRPWQGAGRDGDVLADAAPGPWSTWDGTIGQPGDESVLVVYLGGRAGTLPAGSDAHGDPSPAEADRLAAALDGVLPGFAAARNDVALRSVWAADPWARGSYSCRRPGQWTGFGNLATRQGPFVFAGEHVARRETGYMNSAVESGFDAAVAVRLAAGLG